VTDLGQLKARVAVAAFAAVLLAGTLAACGGNSSTSSTAATTNPSTTSETTRRIGGLGPNDVSREFLTPGGDNSVQIFGEEASPQEVEEISAVLSAYMEARAKGDWTTACRYLFPQGGPPGQRGGPVKDRRCPARIAKLEGQLPASARANSMTGPVDSVRHEGERAYALYHGTHGADYYIPMLSYYGDWKVVEPAPTKIPDGK
jgi:hypothetical protein